MSFDPDTADRIRAIFEDLGVLAEERPIIGGALGFCVDGKLCCAVRTDGLTVRVGPAAKHELVGRPHVLPHLVGRRETAAFVVIEPAGYDTDDSLSEWIRRGLQFVRTL
jgi:hypothetical protein